MAEAIFSTHDNPRRSIMQEPAVYQLLGRLENGMANANKKLDELTTQMSSLVDSTDNAHERLDALEVPVKDWVSTKKNAFMAILGLGTIGGAGGTGIIDAIKTLFGGN